MSYDDKKKSDPFTSFAQQTANNITSLVNHGLSNDEVMVYVKKYYGYTRADLVAAIRNILTAKCEDDADIELPRIDANFIQEANVIDPATGSAVTISVYKDEASGGMFAIDTSYILAEEPEYVPSLFNRGYVRLQGD